MSNASAHEATPQIDDSATYSEMNDVLDEILEESLRKIRSGRVYDPANERVRIKWIRLAKDIVDVKRKVQADSDLVELTERLNHLEQTYGGQE